MIKIMNAFALSMVDTPASIEVEELTAESVKALAPFESVVGHADTAHLIGELLGMTVPMNRVSIKLNKGEKAVVAQYMGPRLAEGTKTLPEGATFKFLLVSVR